MKKLLVLVSFMAGATLFVSAQNAVVTKETKMEQPKAVVTEASNHQAKDGKHNCSKESAKSCCSKSTSSAQSKDSKSCSKESGKSCCSKKSAEAIKQDEK